MKHLLTFSLLSLLHLQGTAGMLFLYRSFSTGIFQGPVEYSTDYSLTSAEWAEGLLSATTEEDIRIQYPDEPEPSLSGREAVAYMMLPKGARVTAVRVNDENTAVRQPTPDLIERIIREGKLAQLSPFLGLELVQVSLPEKEERVSVSVDWSLESPSLEGLVDLKLPMPLASMSSGPVRRAVVEVSIRSDLPVRSVFSPSHECKVKRENAEHAQVRFSQDQVKEDGPFELFAVTSSSPLGLKLFSHRPESAEDGYFLLAGCPTDRIERQEGMEVVFVVDTSGSMRGDKMEQARAALEYCLTQLTPRDRFNIIGFSDTHRSFRPQPVQADPAVMQKALSYIDNLEPGGKTNLADALDAAVTGTPDSNRTVLFLTDGTPTVGERKPDMILSRVKESNRANARLYVIGIGYEVNAYLLDRLAQQTEGGSEYVDPEEDLDERVASVFNRIAYPVMKDVEVAFAGAEVYDVTPTRLQDLYRDTPIMITGRYREGGELLVRLKDGNSKEMLEAKMDVPEACMDHAFIAPLWASRQLGERLEDIRLHGESDEALEQVVRLSREYGVFTAYTAVLNEEPARDLSDAEVVEKVKRAMNRASQVKSGKWAVMQSRNDQDLKNRMVQSAEMNTFLDAQGERQEASNIRQVGGTAYYQQDGVWVAAEDGKARSQRTVERFSEEYFELIRTHEELAKASALKGDVKVNVGDEQITIK